MVFGPVHARAPDGVQTHRAYLERFFSRLDAAPEGLIDHYYGCGNSLVRRAVSRTFAAQSGTPRGQQEPINFGPQSPGGGNLQPGEEGEVPVDPQARRNGRWGDCICCCDGCDCCAD